MNSCSPVASAPVLNFTAAPSGAALSARDLLTRQRVPVEQLVSIPEALNRAPLGSLILACWKSSHLDNLWGPCSHATRKITPELLTESSGALKGPVGFVPLSHQYNRYAVIVLDTPVTAQQLQAMQSEAQRLKGSLYDLSGDPGTYYCTTYQNRLHEVAGLPEPIPYNRLWQLYLPADALQLPGAKVLWVGVNPNARK